MKKYAIYIIIIFLISTVNYIHAQTLNVTINNGTRYTYYTKNVETMTFNSKHIIINQRNGTKNTYDLSKVSYMDFKLLGSIENIANSVNFYNKEFVLYPNPVRNYLQVFASPPHDNASFDYTIINISGKVVSQGVLHFHANESDKTDISHLPLGIYLFRMQNKSSYYTEKFIKY